MIEIRGERNRGALDSSTDGERLGPSYRGSQNREIDITRSGLGFGQIDLVADMRARHCCLRGVLWPDHLQHMIQQRHGLIILTDLVDKVNNTSLEMS